MIGFEIVHTDADQPFHTRIKAGNSRKWFVSETYTRRASAVKAAVNLIVDLVQPDYYELRHAAGGGVVGLLFEVAGAVREVEIVDVDERTP